jgi:hypothetical protein
MKRCNTSWTGDEGVFRLVDEDGADEDFVVPPHRFSDEEYADYHQTMSKFEEWQDKLQYLSNKYAEEFELRSSEIREKKELQRLQDKYARN